MNRYPAVLRAVAETPWAILPEKLQAIVDLLVARAAGGAQDQAAAAFILGGGAREDRKLQVVGSVAILPVTGTIMYRADSLLESSGVTSTQRLSALLREALADPAVKSIVLDVNSPGGTVPGVMEFADEVLRAREQKRIVAVANPRAASAAYWIAAAASELVVMPSGDVGSIGVYTVHEDISRALEEAGVKVSVMRAGKFKAEGLPYEPLTDEGRAAVQERLDVHYDRFVKAVAKGRGATAAAVKAGFGQGRMVLASQAVEAGMADRVGTLEDVVQKLNRAKQGANLPRAEETSPAQVAAARFAAAWKV
ncbi:MAG: S49 family peptidase [Planctomycetaceae bacterium]|nr:S49 family peptidase [Planctomycetaceae bacterium]